MEQDSQQLSTSTAAVSVISRLDRLDRLLQQQQQLEKKQSCCSSHKCSIPVPADGELDKHCKRLSSALEEVDSKGTLMERLTMLENRVVQLSLVMEDGNTSSSSTWTKTDVENITQKLPAEQEGKLISSVQKQESLIIEGKGFQEAQNGDTHNQKKRTRRKKTTSMNPDSRRFGWFHMGC